MWLDYVWLIITYPWSNTESLAETFVWPLCSKMHFHVHPSLSRTHTGKQTWWLWLCTFPAGLVSPARSSPLLPPAWQGPAQGSPASAAPSHGLNAGLWSGGELAFPPAGRSEVCHLSDAMPTPWTWHEEPTGWTRQPGNGRRKSSGSENTPCCPRDRGYVHSAWKKKWKLRNEKLSDLIPMVLCISNEKSLIFGQWGVNLIKDNAHIGDVLTYVALGILGQSTRTHWKPPYVLMHIWSFVQLFCLVAHSSMSVRKHQHSETFKQKKWVWMPLILFLIFLCELEPFLMKLQNTVKFLKIYEISEKVKGFLSHVV